MTTTYGDLTEEAKNELECIAQTLVTLGKGIVTVDESATTLNKRLLDCGISTDENSRKQWRQVLFSCDPKIKEYVSGVVLNEETLCQKDENGKLLVDYLKDRCILIGIKVDCGLVNLPCSEDEFVTLGLDSLAERLIEYKKIGCEFARWRCVFKISKNTPSIRSIKSNVEILARFASICQCLKICPLVEPEVCPEGSHDINQCQNVTEMVLSFLFKYLNDHRVFLEGIVLKVNMVTSGMSFAHNSPEEIAKATVTALRRTVPPAIPGICFSSDGQTEEEAPINLHAIIAEETCKPWNLTFAFGRPVQASALRVWNGNPMNVRPAQEEFLKHTAANAYACRGQFQQTGDMMTESQQFPHNDTCDSDLGQPQNLQNEQCEDEGSTSRYEIDHKPQARNNYEYKRPEIVEKYQYDTCDAGSDNLDMRKPQRSSNEGSVVESSDEPKQFNKWDSATIDSRSTECTPECEESEECEDSTPEFTIRPPFPKLNNQQYSQHEKSSTETPKYLAAPPMLDPLNTPPLLNPTVHGGSGFGKSAERKGQIKKPDCEESNDIDPNYVRSIPDDCRQPPIPRVIAPKIPDEPDVHRL